MSMNAIAIELWVGFTAVVLVVLVLDLAVLHRSAHVVRVREAATWVAVWVTLALGFGAVVFRVRGSQAGLEFFTGYLIELALSVDNVFVFLLILSYFRVDERYRHRVLFWGILGALVMRGGMIGAGAYLISQFKWVTYAFGALLVVTGIRMARMEETTIEPAAHPLIRFLPRVLPVTTQYHGQRFMIRDGGRWVATPLLLVLLMIETTDLAFAVDSIPAVFAVTRDPFIVYTSNVFAILGLRSLYFLVAGVIERFHQLKRGLAVVLAFVGVKMLLTDVYHIPVSVSLGVVGGILAGSVVLSLVFPKLEAAPGAETARRRKPLRELLRSWRQR
jgi:tellurite resistance protein TerC